MKILNSTEDHKGHKGLNFFVIFVCFCSISLSSFSQTEPNPIRLLCDIYNRGNTIDLNTGQPAQFYRGDDIEIDIGIGTNGALYTNTIVTYSNLVCSVFRTQNDTNPPMMQATVYATNLNTALTAAQWNNNAAPYFHAAFPFTGAQSAIPLYGNSSASYWLRVNAITTNSPTRTLTLEDGPITVLDGPISSLAPAVTAAQTYLTVSNSTGTLVLPTNFFAANSNLLNQAIPPSAFSGVALTNYANGLSTNGTNFAQGVGATVTNFFQWGAPTLSNLVAALAINGSGQISNSTVVVTNSGGNTIIASNQISMSGTNGGKLTFGPYGITNSGSGLEPFNIATFSGLYQFGRFGTFTAPILSSDLGNFATDGSGDVTIGEETGGQLTILKNNEPGITINQSDAKESIHLGPSGTDDAIALQGTNYVTGGTPFVGIWNNGSGEFLPSFYRYLWTVQAGSYNMTLYATNADIVLPVRLKSGAPAGTSQSVAWINTFNSMGGSNTTEFWILNHSGAGNVTISDTNADNIVIGSSSATSLVIPPGGWVHCWTDGTNINADGERVLVPGTYITIATNGMALTLALNTAITNALNAQVGVLSTNATNYANSLIPGGFNGAPLTNFAGLLSTNATNWAVSQATAATSVAENFASSLSALQGAAVTNYAATLSTNATNYALSQGVAATAAAETYAALLGQTLTNWAGILSTNATNWASSLIVGSFSGTALTNLIGLVGTNLTNWSGILATNATNFAATLSTNATNWAATIGANGTNYVNQNVTAAEAYAALIGTTVSNQFQWGSVNLSNINSAVSAGGGNVSLAGNLTLGSGGIPFVVGISNMGAPLVITNGPGYTGIFFATTNTGGSTLINSNYTAWTGTNGSRVVHDGAGNITNSGSITTGGLTTSGAINQTSVMGPNTFAAGTVINNSLSVTGNAFFSGSVSVPLATLIPARQSSSTTLDWSQGFAQSNYLASAATYSLVNTTDGQDFTVSVTDSGGHSITWSVPAGQTLKWSGGAAPSQTANKTDIYTFIKIGSTIYGTDVQNF